MDLLDLYHAHDHSLAFDDTYENPSKSSPPSPPKRVSKKPKEAKFVPWEPYRAASSSSLERKGGPPKEVPSLIPYATASSSNREETPDTTKLLIDALKNKRRDSNHNITVEPAVLEEHVIRLNKELEAERNVNRELKSIFLKSLGDDFQCEVEALAGDKVQLSRRLEDYCEKVVALSHKLEDVQIEAEVWKCKYLAQSIRCDELSRRLNAAAGLLHQGQESLRSLGSHLPESLHEMASLDIPSLLGRSPCDPRVTRRLPNFSNITVNCCKNCNGREIVLL